METGASLVQVLSASEWFASSADLGGLDQCNAYLPRPLAVARENGYCSCDSRFSVFAHTLLSSLLVAPDVHLLSFRFYVLEWGEHRGLVLSLWPATSLIPQDCLTLVILFRFFVLA